MDIWNYNLFSDLSRSLSNDPLGEHFYNLWDLAHSLLSACLMQFLVMETMFDIVGLGQLTHHLLNSDPCLTFSHSC